MPNSTLILAGTHGELGGSLAHRIPASNTACPARDMRLRTWLMGIACSAIVMPIT